MKKTLRVIGLLCVVAAACAAAYFGRIASNIAGSGGGGIGGILDTIRDPESRFPGKDRVYVLLIGKDYNHTNKGIQYTANARSDSLVMFALDLKNRRVSALSIPRDTKIPGKFSKINAAYSRGGAEETMDAVESLLGVRPDYYVALKPDAVKEIVDAVDGVEVETLDAMDYDDNWGNLHIHLPKGKQTVNGEQAVGFTRYREPNKNQPTSLEDSDHRRMARQQQLIRAIIARVKEPRYLLQADKLVDLSLEQVDTKLDRPQLMALAAMFRNIQPDQIQSATLEGDGRILGKTYFIIPDEEKAKAQVDWILRGDETAAYRVTLVAVQNATRISGAARRAADILRGQGFDAKNAGNAGPKTVSGSGANNGGGGGDSSGELTQTRIVYAKAAVESRARKIAALLGGGELVKDPAQNLSINEKEADVTVLLGRDVAGKLSARQSASR